MAAPDGLVNVIVPETGRLMSKPRLQLALSTQLTTQQGEPAKSAATAKYLRVLIREA